MTWILLYLCAHCTDASIKVGAYTSSLPQCVETGEVLYERNGLAWMCASVDPEEAIDARVIWEYHHDDE